MKNWLGSAAGEWVEEPDHVVFIYKGLECKVVRIVFPDEPNHIFGGYLCGYVLIPANHPYHNRLLRDLKNIDSHGGTDMRSRALVTGIGFDCGHLGDYLPSTEYFKKTNLRRDFPLPAGFEKYAIFNPVYRNINFCIEECKGIVDQSSLLSNRR